MLAEIEDHGSLTVFRARDHEAQNWVLDNVSSDGFQPEFPNTVYVDHGFAYDLVLGFQRDGGALA